MKPITFAATLLATALAASLPAAAAQLKLTVLNADGKPVQDVAVQVSPTAAWAGQPLPPPVVILQQIIRFVPFVTVVPVGATVRFINKDKFDHHVRSQPGGPLGNVAPAKQFEFRMVAAKDGRDSAAADLKLDTVGIVAPGCERTWWSNLSLLMKRTVAPTGTPVTNGTKRMFCCRITTGGGSGCAAQAAVGETCTATSCTGLPSALSTVSLSCAAVAGRLAASAVASSVAAKVSGFMVGGS